MDLQNFSGTHLPALERDEVRFGMLIHALAAAARNASSDLALWTLGGPGHCAARVPRRSILLGALDAAECRRLAQDAISVADAGVAGADDTAHWFVEEAASLGVKLGPPIPQRIHVLRQPPSYPQTAGTARPATAEDAPLIYAWLSAFRQEATPHDPAPTREDAERAAQSGRFQLWTVDGQPVAMAAVNRSLRQSGSIGAVYTPPEHRNRGYAGSVTAALADRILADGKTVCLHTDLRNPASNRCYAKIGFVAYCEAWHYPPTAA
jgi:RimJ/RimL family protein N-acetyltransferase